MTWDDDMPPVLTVDEAAKILGISRGLAFAAVARGELPSKRVGRRILVPTQRLHEWLLDIGDEAAR